MLSQLSSAAKVVGVKQSKKVIRDGSATHAFIAADAERRITAPIYELCEALGSAVGIAVGAAVVTVID